MVIVIKRSELVLTKCSTEYAIRVHVLPSSSTIVR